MSSPLAAALWTADANETLRLSLIRAKEDEDSISPEEAYHLFHPTFTYPVFGDDQKIYGYKNLEIDLKFASASLTPYLKISYSERLPQSAAVDDPEKALREHLLPPDYYTDEAEFLKRVEEEATTFKPFGELIHTYTRDVNHAVRVETGSDDSWDDRKKPEASSSKTPEPPAPMEIVQYEIYRVAWRDTPEFKEYLRRMQPFILLYIEGGSKLNEDEEEWEFFVLYEKRQRKRSPGVWTYHFVGYSSLFPFYCYPEKIRLRISQFVILPPYQQEGHGSALYNAIYRYVLSQPHIAELTVEDPAEAFEDLRDRNDLQMLLNHEEFMRSALGEELTGAAGGVGPVRNHGVNGVKKRGKSMGKLGPPTDKAWLAKWNSELKIAKRQFHRLIEMLMLKYIDQTDPLILKAYRLQVKDRLYRFNFELLMQLDKRERMAKLEETFQAVKKDYVRILNMIH
ncbi:histone acetyltransferase type B catalytic subunit [Panus rudis PR-1116 ss-1]|nr:histone acetyltransferase type B catalytic subunit [Panus rudis PR-1116 ss-1]